MGLTPLNERSHTGGQFSLLRGFLGAWLAVRFVVALELDASLAVVVPAIAAALFLAVGRRDRLAAAVCLVALIALRFLPRGVETTESGVRIAWHAVGTIETAGYALLLAFQLATPPAPLGSLDARGRVDPRGGWRLPSPLFDLLWIGSLVVFALAGAAFLASRGEHAWSPSRLASGTGLSGILFLSFAGLAVARRTRPVAWLVLAVATALSLVSWTWGKPQPVLGLPLLAFLIDPRWLPPARRGETAVVYYDGDCGLCHGTVRLLVAEDVAGALRFAPLAGETFANSGLERERLPDSLVLVGPDGVARTRGAAVREALERIGGLWRALGLALRVVPRPLLDWGYDRVARVRERFFRAPQGACPVLPPDLATRFLA